MTEGDTDLDKIQPTIQDELKSDKQSSVIQKVRFSETIEQAHSRFVMSFDTTETEIEEHNPNIQDLTESE